MGTAREAFSNVLVTAIIGKFGEHRYCLPSVHPLPVGTWLLDDHLNPHEPMRIVRVVPHTQGNAEWWYEVRYPNGKKGGGVEWRHPWVRCDKSAVRGWLNGKVNPGRRVMVTLPGVPKSIS